MTSLDLCIKHQDNSVHFVIKALTLKKENNFRSKSGIHVGSVIDTNVQ